MGERSRSISRPAADFDFNWSCRSPPAAPKRWQRARTRSDACMDKVIDFINVNRDRYLEELRALLAIPSISALPQHAGDVKRCADWCADEMRRIGLQHVRLVETPGNPVVYGDWLGAPGAPRPFFFCPFYLETVRPLHF